MPRICDLKHFQPAKRFRPFIVCSGTAEPFHLISIPRGWPIYEPQSGDIFVETKYEMHLNAVGVAS